MNPTGSHGFGQRLPVLLVTALAVLSIGAGAMSFAAFTDDAAVTTNGFATGTVELTTSPTSALFNVSAIVPGYTSTASLTVNNGGTADVAYTMSTAATNTDNLNLRDQLTLAVKTEDTDGGCDGFDGTELFSGTLANGAISSARTLNASANEVLCFRVTLPSTTGNEYQGAATTATFTFNATTP